MNPLHNNTILDNLYAATDITVIKDKKLFAQLSVYINGLINNDFAYLLSLLYRIDVDEKKIRFLLDSKPGTNAGELVARLIIERQVEKIKTRNQFKPPTSIPEEEEW